MANKSSKQRLGDVCEINQFKRDKNWKHPFIEYIDISSVGVGHFVNKPNIIPIKEAPSRAQRLVQDGDTILSTVRPNRRSMLYIKSPKQNTLVSTGFAVLHPKKIDPRFLYYSVFDQEFTDYLTARADGSAYPAVSPEVILDAEVDLLSLPEQYAIAEILGALDDKIEVNRRMNATLESMARAVFRQWFVENKELENWEIKTIGDICEFAYGKGLKADGRKTGTIPVYGSNGQIGWHNEYLVKGPGIVVGRKGNPGIVTWAQVDFFPIDTTFYVVPKDKATSFYWLYYTLISKNLPDLGADSAVPGLNRNIAYMSIVNYPSYIKMKEFDDFAKPIFNKINSNNEQSRTLADLRDSLLPKLMRGEVRIGGKLDVTNI
jgi:type I restriction enzyme, S subunit